MDNNIKKCSKCEKDKPLKDYSPDKRTADGTQSQCRVCRRDNQRVYYENNKTKVHASNRNSYEKYKEQRRESARAYQEKNKHLIKVKRKEYYEKNKPAILESMKAAYWADPVKAREKERLKYKSKCREKINETMRKYDREQYKNNPQYKLSKLLRDRVRDAIKYQNTTKAKRTLELIGCTIKHLVTHIEKQFKPGMTWENHGRWHIDHIRPCISFDLTDVRQQEECFNYTNLQPLWAAENFRKGVKYHSQDISKTNKAEG